MPIKELDKEILKEKTGLEGLSLEEFKAIKAVAFKTKDGNKKGYALDNKNSIDKYSCGWSVCHCATYGCN